MNSEPHPEDVAEVLSVVAAKLDARAQGSAARGAAVADLVAADSASDRRLISESRSAMLGRLRELEAEYRHLTRAISADELPLAVVRGDSVGGRAARPAAPVLGTHGAEVRNRRMTRHQSDPFPTAAGAPAPPVVALASC